MKKCPVCILISLSIALLLIALSSLPFLQVLELKLYDLRVDLRKNIPQDKSIVYVEMDDIALKSLGRWPWPRDINAAITDTLTSLGAKQIIFDITFSSPTQLIVDKQKLQGILDQKDKISDFIQQVAYGIRQGQIRDKNDIAGYLDQINKGVDQFKDDIDARLKIALIDNDDIFAGSLEKSNVFMGYKFEVIYTDKDILRDSAYPQLKKNILGWIRENPNKGFADLPAQLTDNPYFSPAEINDAFIRLKIYDLLSKDKNLDVDEISQRLKNSPEKVREHFNAVKEVVIRELIEGFLEKNPDAEFKQLIWKYQVLNKSMIEEIRKVWDDLENEREFIKRFAIRINLPQGFLKAIDIDPPILKFTRAIKGAGFLNGIPDIDGVVRRAPLFVKYRENIYPQIGLSSVIALLKPKKIQFIPNKFLILEEVALKGKIKDIRIPVDEKCQMLINWAGKWKDTYRHVSCSDIYLLYLLRQNTEYNLALPKDAWTPESRAAREDDLRRLEESEMNLKQKINSNICIIGLTAPGTQDFKPMPYEGVYPMVGTHGNVINSILNKNFISKVPEVYNYLIVLSVAALLGMVLAHLSSLSGLLVIIFALSGMSLLAVLLFNQGVWINLTLPILSSSLSYLGIISFKFATEEKEKRWIKRAFSRYISTEVMEEILKDPSKLKLGGERKILTVLFSDIKGFTTYSEKRKPEEVVGILNEYLDAMSNVIFEHKGTLDKYVGDEIMAIFGAPRFEEPEVSAKRAITAACKMVERLEQLREKWQKEGKEPLDMGIGINTGEMVVGNVGSVLRMDYTVIGDAVNLGARVETLTRQYNTHIIISEFTYNYVKGMAEVRPLEAIKVKGKEIPVMMYEVLGLKPNDSRNPET
mgnify:CR=1 FL=1